MAEKTGKYVVFLPDKPKTIIIDSYREYLKQITDPYTGGPKMKMVFECHVTEEDGVPCDKTWGVTSEKCKATLRGLDGAGKLLNVRHTITLTGIGFQREYSFAKGI